MKTKILLFVFLIVFSFNGLGQHVKGIDTLTLEQKEQAYLKHLTTKYGVKYAKHIVNEEITLGMTKEMVIESWGMPQGITEKTDASGIFETWSYAIYKYYERWICNYVYFKNNIVIGWKIIK